MSEEMELYSVGLSDINPTLTCPLCRGYLIDCVAAEECGHVFCRSCVLRHIANGHVTCPQCNSTFNKLHPTEPFHKLRPDPILQRLIYKLVPGLLSSETERRAVHYGSERMARKQLKSSVGDDALFFNGRSTVSVELLCTSTDPAIELSSEIPLSNWYIRVEMATTIAILQDFIKLRLSLDEKANVQISANATCRQLPDTFTVTDLAYINKWDMKQALPVYYKLSAATKKPDCCDDPATRQCTSSDTIPCTSNFTGNFNRTEREPSLEYHPPPTPLNRPFISPPQPNSTKLKLKFNRNIGGRWRVAAAAAANTSHRRFPSPVVSGRGDRVPGPSNLVSSTSSTVDDSSDEDDCGGYYSDSRKRLFVDLRDTVKSTKVAKVLPIPVLPASRPIKHNNKEDERIFSKDPTCGILYSTGLVPTDNAQHILSIQQILNTS